MLEMLVRLLDFRVINECTHRTLVMTHVYVTLEIKSRRSRESESLQVCVQRYLMAIVSVVGSSEWTDQLFIRDTSTIQRLILDIMNETK